MLFSVPNKRLTNQTGIETRNLFFLRKEVIQPQVPLRLPCSCASTIRMAAWTISSSLSGRIGVTDPNPQAIRNLVPIRSFIFGACLAAPATSDAPRFGGLTGGVYKAQEHIHRGMLIRDY